MKFFCEGMSWAGGLNSPPPKKNFFFFLKSEGEKIERKRRKIKMDVGGGGICTYFMQL